MNKRSLLSFFCLSCSLLTSLTYASHCVEEKDPTEHALEIVIHQAAKVPLAHLDEGTLLSLRPLAALGGTSKALHGKASVILDKKKKKVLHHLEKDLKKPRSYDTSSLTFFSTGKSDFSYDLYLRLLPFEKRERVNLISFYHCPALKTLPGLTGFPNLREISIVNCHNLTNFQSLKKAGLESTGLHITETDRVQNQRSLASISHYPGISHLKYQQGESSPVYYYQGLMGSNLAEIKHQRHLQSLKQAYVTTQGFDLTLWERVLDLWPRDLEHINDTFFASLRGLGSLSTTCKLFNNWCAPFLNKQHIDEKLAAIEAQASRKSSSIFTQTLCIHASWGNHMVERALAADKLPGEVIIVLPPKGGITFPSFQKTDAHALKTLVFSKANTLSFFDHLSYDGPTPIVLVIESSLPRETLLKRLAAASCQPLLENLRLTENYRLIHPMIIFDPLSRPLYCHKGFVSEQCYGDAQKRQRTLSRETRLETPFDLPFTLWQRILYSCYPLMTMVNNRPDWFYSFLPHMDSLCALFALNLTNKFFYDETEDLTKKFRKLLHKNVKVKFSSRRPGKTYIDLKDKKPCDLALLALLDPRIKDSTTLSFCNNQSPSMGLRSLEALPNLTEIDVSHILNNADKKVLLTALKPQSPVVIHWGNRIPSVSVTDTLLMRQISQQEWVDHVTFKGITFEGVYFGGHFGTTLKEAKKRQAHLAHQIITAPLPHETWQHTLALFAPTSYRKSTSFTDLKTPYYENLKDLKALSLTCQYFWDEVSSFLEQEKKVMPFMGDLPLDWETGASTCRYWDAQRFHYRFRFQEYAARQITVLTLDPYFGTRFPDLYLLLQLETVKLTSKTLPDYFLSRSKDAAPDKGQWELRTPRPLVFKIKPEPGVSDFPPEALLAFSQRTDLVHYIKYTDKKGQVTRFEKGQEYRIAEQAAKDADSSRSKETPKAEEAYGPSPSYLALGAGALALAGYHLYKIFWSINK